jgi:hypothetical protein
MGEHILCNLMPCTAFYISCESFVQCSDTVRVWAHWHEIKSEFSTPPSVAWFLVWLYCHKQAHWTWGLPHLQVRIWIQIQIWTCQAQCERIGMRWEVFSKLQKTALIESLWHLVSRNREHDKTVMTSDHSLSRFLFFKTGSLCIAQADLDPPAFTS